MFRTLACPRTSLKHRTLSTKKKGSDSSRSQPPEMARKKSEIDSVWSLITQCIKSDLPPATFTEKTRKNNADSDAIAENRTAGDVALPLHVPVDALYLLSVWSATTRSLQRKAQRSTFLGVFQFLCEGALEISASRCLCLPQYMPYAIVEKVPF